MTPTLNPDYQLIYRKEQTGQLYFKNEVFGNLLQISEVEYDILQAYVRHADAAATTAQFAQEFDIGPEFVPALVDRAQTLDLLLTAEYQGKKSLAAAKRPSRLSEYVSFLTYWLGQLLAPFHIRIKPEFRGNFRFYRVIAVDFQHSLFDRFSASRLGQLLLLGTWLSALLWAVLCLWHRGLGALAPHQLLQATPVGGRYLMLLILLGTLLATFLHEMGHFLLYRYYGGQTSEIGLALTLGVFPVLYVTTNSLYLWDKQYQRLLVTLAGIAVDFGQALLLAALVVQAISPVCTFFSIVFLYLALVRIFSNMNPFIPGSDGYFVATDLANKPSLYQSSAFAATSVLGHFRSLTIGQVSTKEWLGFSYMCISICCITFYYTFFGSVLLLPLLGLLN